jgi:hypothetical protein
VPVHEEDPVVATVGDDRSAVGDAERAPWNEAQAFAQQLVRGYGALLRAWPDLVAATRELRARGVEVGVPVEAG